MMKCKDCNADMEEILNNLLRKLPARYASQEENLYVPCKSYFITEDGEMVSLYICPKCGKVQGEAFKENGRVVKYC